MKKRIYAAGIILFSALATAQEKDIEEVNLFGKFLQTPMKEANLNVTLIQKKEIENSSSRSIDELLQQVTGLDIRRRGSNGVQSDVSIRGGNFEQVLILIVGYFFSVKS